MYTSTNKEKQKNLSLNGESFFDANIQFYTYKGLRLDKFFIIRYIKSPR